MLHKSHYLGFGAAGALLHHLRHDLRLALAPRSVQVGQFVLVLSAVLCSGFVPPNAAANTGGGGIRLTKAVLQASSCSWITDALQMQHWSWTQFG